MYRQGTVKSSAVRAASLVALAAAGLLGLAVPASAAGTTPADYSCSLAGYGQGLPPLTIPASLSAQSTGVTVKVNLATQPVQLPAAAAAALPQLTYLGVAGTAQANGMSGRAVQLSGQSGYLGAAAGSMTQLPAMTATGSVTMAGSGQATVEIPPTLTLTPVGAASSAQRAPLTCTTSSATTVQVTAATGAPGAGAAPGASGQAYTCTVTVGTAVSTASAVPMTLTAAGPAAVGTPDTLMLSGPASALGPAFPVSATPMSASGMASLGGTGVGGTALSGTGLSGTNNAGTGSIPLTGLTDSGNGLFRLTGPWMPRMAGMVRIFAPHRFMARLREQTQTAVMVTVACTATTASTTTTQVMVQAAANTAGMASASAAPPAAAPGAPNTGGGGSLHPGSDLPLAAGGAAAVLAGLGIALYTLRRRRGVTG